MAKKPNYSFEKRQKEIAKKKKKEAKRLLKAANKAEGTSESNNSDETIE